jgi:hypothetical protein
VVSEPIQATSKRGWIVLAVLVLLLTVFLTGFVIHFSNRYGRLAFPPQYNDSNYLTDGLQRVDLFMRTSLREVYRKYRDHPPHSPISTLLAATGFIVFGISESSPYIMNALLLAGYFGLVLFVLRSAALSGKICGLLLAASSPIAFCTVHEFEPDYATALLIFWALAIFVYHLQENPAARWPLWTSGALFGVALITKVPFFPFTLLMIAFACCLQIHHNWRVRRSGIGSGTPILKLRRFLLPAVLIPLPHYRYGGRKAVQYILENAGEQSQNWRFGSISERALFYWVGDSANLYLGPMKWGLFAGIFLGLVAVIFSRRTILRTQLLYQGVVALVIYGLLLLLHLKSTAFGFPFELSLLLFVLLTLALVAEQLQRIGPRWLGCVFWVLFIFEFVYRFAPPAELNRVKALTTTEARFLQKIPGQILSTIEARLPEAKNSTVFLTFNGNYLNAQMLEWLALKENVVDAHRQQLDFWTAPNKSREELIQKARDSAFMLTADPGIIGVKPQTHPTNTRGPELLEFARHDAHFKEIATFPAPDGHRFYLFLNDNPKVEQ